MLPEPELSWSVEAVGNGNEGARDLMEVQVTGEASWLGLECSQESDEAINGAVSGEIVGEMELTEDSVRMSEEEIDEVINPDAVEESSRENIGLEDQEGEVPDKELMHDQQEEAVEVENKNVTRPESLRNLRIVLKRLDVRVGLQRNNRKRQQSGSLSRRRSGCKGARPLRNGRKAKRRMVSKKPGAKGTTRNRKRRVTMRNADKDGKSTLGRIKREERRKPQSFVKPKTPTPAKRGRPPKSDGQKKPTRIIHQCDLCARRFRVLERLHRHRISHFYSHVEQCCRFCQRIFLTENGLRQHEKLHDPKTGKMKGARCMYCNKVFTGNEYYLAVHIKSHCKMKDGKK